MKLAYPTQSMKTSYCVVWEYLLGEVREQAAGGAPAGAHAMAFQAKGKGKEKGKDKNKGKGKGQDSKGKGDGKAPKGAQPPPGGGKGPQAWMQAGQKQTMCRNFTSEQGCKHGGICRYVHQRLLPTDGRSFNCGSTQHRSGDCSAPRRPGPEQQQQKLQPPGAGGAAQARQAGAESSVASSASAANLKDEVQKQVLSFLEKGESDGRPLGKRSGV